MPPCEKAPALGRTLRKPGVKVNRTTTQTQPHPSLSLRSLQGAACKHGTKNPYLILGKANVLLSLFPPTNPKRSKGSKVRRAQSLQVQDWSQPGLRVSVSLSANFLPENLRLGLFVWMPHRAVLKRMAETPGEEKPS